MARAGLGTRMGLAISSLVAFKLAPRASALNLMKGGCILQHWRLRAVTGLLTCAGEPQLCWRISVISSTGSHRRRTRCHTLHSAHSPCYTLHSAHSHFAFHNTGSAHEWASSVLRADKYGRTAHNSIRVVVRDCHACATHHRHTCAMRSTACQLSCRVRYRKTLKVHYKGSDSE